MKKLIVVLLFGLSLSLALLAGAEPAQHQPQTVRPAADGHMHLWARQARGLGPRIEFMPEWDAFGWFTAADRVEWQLADVKPGHYRVLMTWSVSDKEAGKPLVIEAGAHQLEAVVEKTGSWETFITAPLGVIYLGEDVDTLVLRPASRFAEGALLDVRKLELVPED